MAARLLTICRGGGGLLPSRGPNLFGSLSDMFLECSCSPTLFFFKAKNWCTPLPLHWFLAWKFSMCSPHFFEFFLYYWLFYQILLFLGIFTVFSNKKAIFTISEAFQPKSRVILWQLGVARDYPGHFWWPVRDWVWLSDIVSRALKLTNAPPSGTFRAPRPARRCYTWTKVPFQMT